MQFSTPGHQKEKASVSAKKEREIRRQRKRGDVAVTKIIVWWRGIVAGVKGAERLQKEYDELFLQYFPDESCVNTLKLKPLKVPIPDGDAVLSLLVHYMRIPIKARRRESLMTLVRVVTISLGRQTAAQNYAASYFTKQCLWMAVTQRLVRGAVAIMAGGAQGANKVCFGSGLKLLLDLTNFQSWTFLKQESQTARVAMLQKLTTEVLPSLLSCVTLAPFPDLVVRHFESPLYSGTADDVLTTGLMTLCCKASASSRSATLSVSMFSCIPNFSALLPEDARTILLRNKKYWELLFQASSGLCAGPCATPKWPAATLTCNILEIGKKAVQKNPELGPSWCRCVSQLMESIPARSDMVRLIEANDVVSAQLQTLWDPGTVALLFPGLLEEKTLVRSHTSFLFGQMRMRSEVGNCETTVTAALAVLCMSCPPTWEELFNVPAWLPSCRLFNGLVYSWDTRTAIDTLSSHPYLLNAVWSHIYCHIKKYETYVDGQCSDEGLGEVLLLFLHCYDNVLQVTDDKEFYDMQRPFSLTTVAYMITLFSKLAFRLMWDGIADTKAAVGAFAKQKGGLETRLLLLSRSLLQKLNQRNTRKTFCPESSWLIPEFKQSRDFNFTDVLKYLKENTHNNPFENLFGVLRELSSEMLQSNDPLERHFGDIFGNLRNLFSGLHEIYRHPRRQEATTVSSNEHLLRYQCLIRPMPFVIAYKERLEYLRCLIERDRESHHASDVKFPVTVRRTHVLEDSVKEVARLDAAGSVHLKAQLHVKFLNLEGLPEDGIDEGGLFKELLEIVIKKAFSPELGFFIETEDRALYPNPSSKQNTVIHGTHLDFFKFLGRVLAKAVYEGVVVDVVFAEFFLNTMLTQTNNLGDLASYDKELFRNLLSLKDIHDVEELDLNFALYDPTSCSHVQLVPNGENIVVTHANLSSYLRLVTNYKLNLQFVEQSAAFVSGFHEILPPSMLALFDRNELQQLISGLDGSFDILELRGHTRYEGYTPDAPVINFFWDVLSEFSDAQKSDFLRFVTSSARPPLLGLGHITPPFMIRAVPTDSSTYVDRLPSASTCFNLLCLPLYPTKENLKDKILYAITSGTGFELS
eukprot:TRINITY_DN36890_c0_g1_i1.p1 TRINITY_DN36890_c0_g1~~TRINITY_DN36890_c0_g1_i1.p1  ORF type:complete len:1102 (+),score=159.20 TRINITY_DN36890_c0_g1_i1:34-3306(+)